MSQKEFWDATPRSFHNVLQGYHRKKERENKENWEMARYNAYCAMVVHLDNKNRQSMQKMLPLPWDKEAKKEARKITKEDTKKLLKQWQIKASVQ